MCIGQSFVRAIASKNLEKRRKVVLRYTFNNTHSLTPANFIQVLQGFEFVMQDDCECANGADWKKRSHMNGRDYVAAVLACLAAVTVSNVAQGAPISRGNMPAYCRGEVTGMYGTRRAT